MVGATLGSVINHDHSNLVSGARARVRLEHDILSPVKQAYPPMRFDFGEGTDQTFVLLTFKYERFCCFFRTCGLLKHKPEGCQGPPDMSVAGLLGDGGLVLNPNPSPSLSNNPFSNHRASSTPLLKQGGPVIFSQPAVSAPVKVRQSVEILVLSGKKRDTFVLMEFDLGKRPKGCWGQKNHPREVIAATAKTLKRRRKTTSSVKRTLSLEDELGVSSETSPILDMVAVEDPFTLEGGLGARSKVSPALDIVVVEDPGATSSV
ncbi:hypothetical protein ACLB2K_025377 [Fragaria x ananassa]